MHKGHEKNAAEPNATEIVRNASRGISVKRILDQNWSLGIKVGGKVLFRNESTSIISIIVLAEKSLIN